MQQLPNHFSEIIQHHFNNRLKRNPLGYSMRAFARDLEMSPATLSLILQKKAGLSQKKAEVVSKKLQLSGDDEGFFHDLVQSNCAKSKIERQIASAKLFRYETSYNSVETDIFYVIKDWFHLAIMELTLIKGFEPEATWIAKRLNITEEEAESGLERLIRLEILEMTNGKLRPANDYLIVLSKVPSEAAKHFQTQVLQKIMRSFDEVERSSRDIASVMIRMRASEMESVVKTLKETRRDIASRVQSGDDQDSVFCLTTSFFRLDTPEPVAK
jgi:uncharacterized protein (TIGR02147 family)